eukprot:6244771-Lingulodinium_polyedra.AAC.2
MVGIISLKTITELKEKVQKRALDTGLMPNSGDRTIKLSMQKVSFELTVSSLLEDSLSLLPWGPQGGVREHEPASMGV